MNKYKIVSLVLAIALLASLVVVVKQSKSPVPVDRTAAVFENIYARKSVRDYTERSPTAGQIDSLLRAAMAAPTARDRRPWRFVVVDNEVILDSLGYQLPYAAMTSKAPVAIVVCGELSPGVPVEHEMWMQDCSAATENLLLAAEAMGLGAVWTGVYPYEDRMAVVKRLLRLPDNVIPLNVIPVGYPAGNTAAKKKYDKKNIHFNAW